MNHKHMLDFSVGIGEVYCADSEEILDISSVHLRHLKPLYKSDLARKTPYKGEMWILVPSVLSGSDYSGSILERSNYNQFLEQFSDIEGIIELYGGHGSYGIGLTLKALSNKEIRECLSALKDYPVIDEEELSKLEYETYLESWDSREFIRELNKSLNIEDDHPFLWDELDSLESDQLRMFYESLIPSGEYYISESGYDSVYIPINKAVEKCEIEHIVEFLSELS